MSVALHHRVTSQPNMNKVLMWSLIGHVLVLVALSFSILPPHQNFRPRHSGQAHRRAATTASSKPVVPEKVRTQDSAAPKEPPPEMKNIPPVRRHHQAGHRAKTAGAG